MTESQPRVPYQEASRLLLRESILGAVHDLLLERDWSKVTMTDVAAVAGISRQTLYNEFGSRQGLAEGYALQLVDRFVDAVASAVYAHVGDARAALVDGFAAFFQASTEDPLVCSLRTGAAKPDLLRIVTTDSAPLIERASGRLAETFRRSWIQASEADSVILARGVVRVALSYVSMPPASDGDDARDLAALLAPFVDVVAHV
ncbi:TetR family transcriptional regulator [Rhodococcus sp. AG1013]|uniref:TetR family transcriptional regulator n=1 Tax=unclassified Rhodococcus (in: high G+C Gram-positive bacteria) TaxID=192944 RepID=UPI000E0CA966|nr:TetR family transcriptional regulator [Rhodococcus sp. AG1013]RDI25760.1 TetR family transcriptional regulator [Rhodococcus sp. AG1013]